MKLDRLREWRDYRGLTQEELAERAEVARYSISNYEKGKTSARRPTALKIAGALDIDLQDLQTPPARPKVPAPLLSLSEGQRRELLRLLATKHLPAVEGGDELETFAELMRSAGEHGMSAKSFRAWFAATDANDVRSNLLPEEGATLGDLLLHGAEDRR